MGISLKSKTSPYIMMEKFCILEDKNEDTGQGSSFSILSLEAETSFRPAVKRRSNWLTSFCKRLTSLSRRLICLSETIKLASTRKAGESRERELFVAGSNHQNPLDTSPYRPQHTLK